MKDLALAAGAWVGSSKKGDEIIVLNPESLVKLVKAIVEAYEADKWKPVTEPPKMNGQRVIIKRGPEDLVLVADYWFTQKGHHDGDTGFCLPGDDDFGPPLGDVNAWKELS